jgi:hypothetical protein
MGNLPAIDCETKSGHLPFDDALRFAPRFTTPAMPNSRAMALADFGDSSINSTPTPTPGMQ